MWYDDDMFPEFRKIRKRMNRLIGGMSGGEFGSLGREPMTDVRDAGDRFVVKLDMPGIDKKDVDIRADEKGVEVKADKKEKKITDEENFYSQERRQVGYHRILPMPAKIKPEKIDAEYEKGVLTLRLEKKNKKKSKKKVRVRVK